MTDEPGKAGARPVPNQPDDSPADELAPRRERRREGREVPCDLAMERVLLGAAMIDSEAASVAAALPPGAFWGGPTYRVARVVAELERDGEHVGPHVVANRLARDGELDAVGGLPGLHQIVGEVGSTTAAPTYARTLLDLHRLRTTIAAAEAALDAAYCQDLKLAVGCMASAIDDMPDDDLVGDMEALVPQYLELLIAREAGETNAMATGLHDLDEITGGLHPGNLMVVGARTGAGKTATLCQLAINLGQAGRRVLFVSLEMPWPELLDRWVGNIARVNTRNLRRGDIGNGWANVTNALERVVRACADRCVELGLRWCCWLESLARGGVDHLAWFPRVLRRHGPIRSGSKPRSTDRLSVVSVLGVLVGV